MIEEFGWSTTRQHEFAPFAARGLVPARILEQNRGAYIAHIKDGELFCKTNGTLHFKQTLPLVGDWVALSAQNALIEALLPRTSLLQRPAVSGGGMQGIAANLDGVVVVSAMGAEFNPRRVERLLALAWSSGTTPLLALTKADITDDPETYMAQAALCAPGVEIFALSSVTQTGLEALRSQFSAGRTYGFIGASGVGKSTLLNALAGDDLAATGAVSALGAKGRHTTTRRQLYKLPNGVLIIDMPGMKTLGLNDGAAQLDTVFPEIDSLRGRCRFHDCHHQQEPDCAIQAALAAGDLSPERWQSYLKLQREAAFEARKSDKALYLAEKQKWAALSKKARGFRKPSAL